MAKDSGRRPSGVAQDQPFAKRLSYFEYDHDAATESADEMFRGIRRGAGGGMLVMLAVGIALAATGSNATLPFGLALLLGIVLLISESAHLLYRRSTR